jgi:hypothetical protein
VRRPIVFKPVLRSMGDQSTRCTLGWQTKTKESYEYDTHPDSFDNRARRRRVSLWRPIRGRRTRRHSPPHPNHFAADWQAKVKTPVLTRPTPRSLSFSVRILPSRGPLKTPLLARCSIGGSTDAWRILTSATFTWPFECFFFYETPLGVYIADCIKSEGIY